MVTIETERVSINKKVEEIISLAGESLRAAYGDEVFPKYERPPRPERLDKIIELVKQSLEARYGPESDTLDPESIFWVSEQEYKDVFEETKEKPPKLLKTALNSLGVPDFWERSLKDNSVFLSNGTVEPLEIYICADRYRHLDLSTFRGRTEFDYQIALKLISHSIFHATVPRFSEDNDHLMGALEQRLELDKKEFPPQIPTAR